MDWYVGALKKYAVFDGRARRKEYWMFALFNMLAYLALAIVELILGIAPYSDRFVLGDIYMLAVLVPALALTVRRLHDTGRSGWWLLLGFVPFGGLVLLAYFLQDGEAGANQYGANPKQAVATQSRASSAWYPDPTGRHELRYWDAKGWTNHVSDSGRPSFDVLGQSEASA